MDCKQVTCCGNNPCPNNCYKIEVEFFRDFLERRNLKHPNATLPHPDVFLLNFESLGEFTPKQISYNLLRKWTLQEFNRFERILSRININIEKNGGWI